MATRMMRAILLGAMVLLPQAASVCAVDSVTNMLNAIRTAEPISQMAARNPPRWLEGDWVCADRMLRFHPHRIDRSAYIVKMRIAAGDIAPSREIEGGFRVFARCVFADDDGGDKQAAHRLNLELKGSAVLLGGPLWEEFLLSKEALPRPTFFILTHKATGSVLLFHKADAPSPGK
jgi:hypothetical protein